MSDAVEAQLLCAGYTGKAVLRSFVHIIPLLAGSAASLQAWRLLYLPCRMLILLVASAMPVQPKYQSLLATPLVFDLAKNWSPTTVHLRVGLLMNRN